MTDDDAAKVLNHRATGMRWGDIAFRLGYACNGDTLRKRFMRWTHSSTWTDQSVTPAATLSPLEYTLPGRPKLLLLPDTQVEAGVPLNHFKAAGRYAAAKKVDAVCHIGDFGNFTSVGTYNTPLSKEGLRLKDDINACHDAMQLFRDGLGGYVPQLQFITLGNHEHRVDRYVGEHPELAGYVGLPYFEKYGWTVYPFLQPVVVNGVYFCHYFTRTAKGWAGKNPHPNAQIMTRREMVSCVAGHTPGLDTYIHPAGGAAGLLRGTIAGSFYQHDEAWMGPQGNRYWRGCLMLTELQDGYYDLVEISMRYLLETYGD